MSGRVNITSLEEFTDDPRNANKGTERGKKMLDKSLAQLGAGRSILVDKNGVIIAGNKTRQAMVEAGMLNARVIETDGNELVVVKRTDLDLMERGGKARQLAYADNVVGQVDFDMNDFILREDIELGSVPDWLGLYDNLDSSDNETDADDAIGVTYKVVATCKSELDQIELMQLLESRGTECKAVMV